MACCTTKVGASLLLVVALSLACLSHAVRYVPVKQSRGDWASVVKPTHAGYLPVDPDGSSIYYAYYEAQHKSEDFAEVPIILWLQGGPGCASTFGGFYELGPWSVTPELGVVPNNGSWNRVFGLLLMDQPVGTGYSIATRGSASVPADEMAMAAHLYAALQGFFAGHAGLAERPLFITGESYAGKYVPSIGHYILQAADDAAVSPSRSSTANATSITAFPASASAAFRAAALRAAAAAAAAGPPLLRRRSLPPGTSPPLFRLAGLVVGNGLTDPRAQTQTLAAAAYYEGLLPPALRDEVAGRAAEVVALIDEAKWTDAHDKREALRTFITDSTGLGTMFDTRRTEEYDPTKSVDRFLNLPEVKDALRASPNVSYSTCSDDVRSAMGGDVMRSVKHLLPDLLARLPVLLYQGQYDILDGVASVTSWLSTLEWEAAGPFNAARGTLWYLGGQEGNGTRGTAAGGDVAAAIAAAAAEAAEAAAAAGVAEDGGSSRERRRGLEARRREAERGDKGEVAGWVRSAGRLTHAVVYRAGHMVPHDQPAAAQQLLEGWVARALEGRQAGRRA